MERYDRPRAVVMKKPKARRAAVSQAGTSPVMVMPRQTTDEIWRRREIREALNDLKAKALRGKTR
jgi:hypothetical protein